MRMPRFNPNVSPALRNKSVREKLRLAGDRVTGGEMGNSRMTADDQRTTNRSRRVGEEGRGLGRVPISGVDASGVTEGMGGNTVKGRSKITGADAEENVSVYPSGMREMMSAATRRTAPVTGGEQEANFSYRPGVASTVTSAIPADVNPMMNYLGGKPTADALASQFGFALDGNKYAEMALRALPATAAVGTVLGLGNVVLGGESMANSGMDLLGMGAGAYGMSRAPYGVGGTTPGGRALRYTGGAVAGKLGSDLIQYLVGGGSSAQTEQDLVNAINALGGRG